MATLQFPKDAPEHAGGPTESHRRPRRTPEDYPSSARRSHIDRKQCKNKLFFNVFKKHSKNSRDLPKEPQGTLRRLQSMPHGFRGIPFGCPNAHPEAPESAGPPGPPMPGSRSPRSGLENTIKTNGFSKFSRTLQTVFGTLPKPQSTVRRLPRNT